MNDLENVITKVVIVSEYGSSASEYESEEQNLSEPAQDIVDSAKVVVEFESEEQNLPKPAQDIINLTQVVDEVPLSQLELEINLAKETY